MLITSKSGYLLEDAQSRAVAPDLGLYRLCISKYLSSVARAPLSCTSRINPMPTGLYLTVLKCYPRNDQDRIRTAFFQALTRHLQGLDFGDEYTLLRPLLGVTSKTHRHLLYTSGRSLATFTYTWFYRSSPSPLVYILYPRTQPHPSTSSPPSPLLHLSPHSHRPSPSPSSHLSPPPSSLRP